MAAAEPPSWEEVSRGLAAREASFQNLSARITYTERARRLRSGPFGTRVQVIDATWTDSGLARADMMEEIERLPGVLRKDRQIMTSNKEGSRILAWGRKRDPHEPDGLSKVPSDIMIGRVLKERGIFWAIQPPELLNLGPHWSPTQVMDGARIELPKLERLNGAETIRVDWSADSMNPPGSAVRGTFWIDRTLGFAVLQSERIRRPTPSSPWKTIEQTVCEDFVEVGELWLPRRATRKQSRYWDDGEYEPGTRELHATFEDWKANQAVDLAAFRLEFPKGTWVTDSIRDLRYTKGKIGDPEIKQAVSAARATLEAYPPPSLGMSERLEEAKKSMPASRSGLSMWMMSLTGCGFILATIATAWWSKVRWKSKPEIGQ